MVWVVMNKLRDRINFNQNGNVGNLVSFLAENMPNKNKSNFKGAEVVNNSLKFNTDQEPMTQVMPIQNVFNKAKDFVGDVAGNIGGGFLDYAKTPEGKQTIMDLIRTGAAGLSSDPYVSSQIIGDLKLDQAQRPIQAAQREKAAQDKQMFDLKLAKTLSETGLNVATTQDYLNKQGQIPKDFTTVTKEEYENVPYSYKKYYKRFKKEDGTYNYGASIQGLEKIEKKLPTDRQSVRDARDASEIVNKNVDFLLTSPSFNRMVGVMKVGAFNLPKAETKTKLKLADQNDIAFMETLKTIAADKFLTTLKNTRSEKTGATGFGQLNATEFKTLERSITSLKETQSPEVFQENLLTIKGILERAARRAERDFISIHRDLPEYDTIPITNYEDRPIGGIEAQSTTDTRASSQKLLGKGLDFAKNRLTGGVEVGEGYSIVGEEE